MVRSAKHYEALRGGQMLHWLGDLTDQVSALLAFENQVWVSSLGWPELWEAGFEKTGAIHLQKMRSNELAKAWRARPESASWDLTVFATDLPLRGIALSLDQTSSLHDSLDPVIFGPLEFIQSRLSSVSLPFSVGLHRFYDLDKHPLETLDDLIEAELKTL